MKTNFVPTLFAAALFSVSFASAQAATNAETETRQRVVNFADLDLNRDDDVAALYRRIRKAAREVCRESGVLEILRTTNARHCAAQATSRGVADASSASLTRYHAARCSRACDQPNELAFVSEQRTEAAIDVAERR